ncbi:MAG TPA: transposase [Longimicrobium sp.]|nr:transposase [Longimicrobium sp.]
MHVLLRLPATVALATLVKQLKGSSSHLTNRGILPRGFRWQGGYGATSVSPRAVPRVRDYIPRQEDHHRDGTVYPAAEP